jgi:opacity protein-like surface antigen
MASVIRRVAEASAATVVTLLGVSSTASASEENGVYLTASYGTALKLFTHSELDDALLAAFDQSLTLESSSVQRHGSIWSAGVGYRMGPNLAVEATYLDLGKVHYDAAGSAVVAGASRPSVLALDTKSRGATLALVGMLPLWNAWGVDARLGAYRGKASTAFVSTIGDNETTQSLSEQSTSLLLGIGGSYVATEHLTVRLDYIHLSSIKEKAFNAEFDADVVTAGVTYAF